MADQEPKHSLGGELQQEITGFTKDKLAKTETAEKILLPNQETIEAEKRAAKEEAEAAK